jgi:hypothetical protein
MGRVEPERELVRRALPFAAPAVVLAFGIGAAFGGWDGAWSAAIGIGVVAANFVVHGLSLARAARISPTALYAVGMIGFVVRLGVIVAIMAVLDRTAFFSPLAFGLAVVPATLLLLAYEMKLLAGRFGSELWSLPTRERSPR